jgi:3',5'-cyclic AMP phosphodiesterase CpdA
MAGFSFSRRDLLKGIGVGSAAAVGAHLLGQSPRQLIAAAPSAPGNRVLRFAQISDIHVEPELGAAGGFTRCLHHLQSQADPPTLILNTGDCIYDSMHQNPTRTKRLWDLWKKILQNQSSLPIEHTIGNHDCWGIDKAKSKTTGQEPLWGKKWAMDALGLAMPYRSFDRNGWHFVVLDSVEPYENTYRGRLGAEQMEWLRKDLASVNHQTPVLVLSHIPIVSPGAVLNDAKESPDHQVIVSGGETHLDAKEIHALFRQQGNVKLCLSGHLHIQDRAQYDGITYISSGAVSGGWWKGKNLDRFDYGYALVDLMQDGSFSYEYVPYGWETVRA